MNGTMNHPLSMPACLTGMALVLGLGSPVKALDQVIGDGPLQYESLPDIGTLQKNVDAIGKGKRSILQDSADSHGLQMVTPSNALPLTLPSSADTSVTRRPVPPRRPTPGRSLSLAMARRLMALPDDAANQLANTWCARYGPGQQIFEGANTEEDVRFVAKAIEKLEEWYPGWSKEALQMNVHIALTDHMAPGGYSCMGPNASYSYVLLSRSDFAGSAQPTAGSLDALVELIPILDHEVHHMRMDVAAGGLASGPEVEAQAVRRDALDYRLAAKDPYWSANADVVWDMGNREMYRADAEVRGDAAWDGTADATPYMVPYSASVQLLQAAKGFKLTDLTYITSQRDAQGNLTLVWEIPNGSQINVTSGADGTCADFPDASGTSANRLCIKS